VRVRGQRRESEQLKPSVYFRRQSCEVAFGERMETASEPRLREAEGDQLGQTICSRTPIAPLLPEPVIRRTVMQEVSQFINVTDSEAAAQQMAQDMPGGEGQLIHRTERRQSNPVKPPHCAATPEPGFAVHAKSCCRIPEAVM